MYGLILTFNTNNNAKMNICLCELSILWLFLNNAWHYIYLKNINCVHFYPINLPCLANSDILCIYLQCNCEYDKVLRPWGTYWFFKVNFNKKNDEIILKAKLFIFLEIHFAVKSTWLCLSDLLFYFVSSRSS